MANRFEFLLNAAKKIDLTKIRDGIELAQSGVEMASAAMDKPEIVLAGLLKTFARRAMNKSLDDQDAKDIARMACKAILGAKDVTR